MSNKTDCPRCKTPTAKEDFKHNRLICIRCLRIEIKARQRKEAMTLAEQNRLLKMPLSDYLQLDNCPLRVENQMRPI